LTVRKRSFTLHKGARSENGALYKNNNSNLYIIFCCKDRVHFCKDHDQHGFTIFFIVPGDINYQFYLNIAKESEA